MQSPAAFLQTVKLPVMSEVAHLLIQTLSDPDAGVSHVHDVIAKDPALTTTLLRMANSAMFGLSRRVTSLNQAISVVGMSQIRARAISICLTDVFPIAPGLDRTEFWRSSLACAGYATWLAAKLDIDPQQAWLTGMMLRLGELIMGQHEPALLDEFERQPRSPGQRWMRQRVRLGFDEGQLTGEMARRWDFPPDTVLALITSGQPLAARPFCRLGAVLHLAGRLADEALVSADTLRALPADVTAALQLPSADMLGHDLPDALAFTEAPP